MERKVKKVEELEFRRLIDQFVKIFSKESTDVKEVSSNGTQKKKASAQAGAGQFSLFDAGESDAEITPFSSRKNITSTEHFYQSIAPGMAMKLFLKNLLNQKNVCFDTETTGLNPLSAELVGIAFSWEASKGLYIPFPEDREAAQQLIEELRPFFEDTTSTIIGQNLKYDIKVLA